MRVRAPVLRCLGSASGDAGRARHCDHCISAHNDDDADDPNDSHGDGGHNAVTARQHDRCYAGPTLAPNGTGLGAAVVLSCVGPRLLDVAQQPVSVDGGTLGSAALCERKMDGAPLADRK